MIIIVGAGLSGLLISYHLKKAGIPFKILEARNRIGGRINTVYQTNKAPVEMGATWFTKQHKHLISLLEDLEIESFEQTIGSSVFYQASSTSPTQIVQIPPQEPSYRISGGSSSLINTLRSKLDEKEVILNQAVSLIKFNSDSVQVYSNQEYTGIAVILAIPPKLWVNKIRFEPQLPNELGNIALHTQTWMEDSIKVALTYKQAFWGDGKLPGTLFSTSGPITEFYDHSNHENSEYALCGFIHSSLKKLSYEDRMDRVITQAKSIFGEKATEFISYEECVWSNEEYTFHYSDNFLSPHQNNGNSIFNNSLFDGRLLISSTESASVFPGYMEGAVYSAKIISEKLIALSH